MHPTVVTTTNASGTVDNFQSKTSATMVSPNTAMHASSHGLLSPSTMPSITKNKAAGYESSEDPTTQKLAKSSSGTCDHSDNEEFLSRQEDATAASRYEEFSASAPNLSLVDFDDKKQWSPKRVNDQRAISSLALSPSKAKTSRLWPPSNTPKAPAEQQHLATLSSSSHSDPAPSSPDENSGVRTPNPTTAPPDGAARNVARIRTKSCRQSVNGTATMQKPRRSSTSRIPTSPSTALEQFPTPRTLGKLKLQWQRSMDETNSPRHEPLHLNLASSSPLTSPQSLSRLKVQWQQSAVEAVSPKRIDKSQVAAPPAKLKAQWPPAGGAHASISKGGKKNGFAPAVDVSVKSRRNTFELTQLKRPWSEGASKGKLTMDFSKLILNPLEETETEGDSSSSSLVFDPESSQQLSMSSCETSKNNLSDQISTSQEKHQNDQGIPQHQKNLKNDLERETKAERAEEPLRSHNDNEDQGMQASPSSSQCAEDSGDRISREEGTIVPLEENEKTVRSISSTECERDSIQQSSSSFGETSNNQISEQATTNQEKLHNEEHIPQHQKNLKDDLRHERKSETALPPNRNNSDDHGVQAWTHISQFAGDSGYRPSINSQVSKRGEKTKNHNPEQAAMSYLKQGQDQYLLQQLRNATNNHRREQKAENVEAPMLRYTNDDHGVQAEQYFLQQLRNATKEYRREAEYSEIPLQNSSDVVHGVQAGQQFSQDAGDSDDPPTCVEGSIIPMEENENYGEPSSAFIEDERWKSQLSSTRGGNSEDQFPEQVSPTQDKLQNEEHSRQHHKSLKDDESRESRFESAGLPLHRNSNDDHGVQAWTHISQFAGDSGYRPSRVEGNIVSAKNQNPEQVAVAYEKQGQEKYLLQQLRNATKDNRREQKAEAEDVEIPFHPHCSDEHSMQAEQYLLQQLRNATKDYRRDPKVQYSDTPLQNSSDDDHGVQAETEVSQYAGDSGREEGTINPQTYGESSTSTEHERPISRLSSTPSTREQAAMAYGKKTAEQYLLQQLRNVTNDQREQRAEDADFHEQAAMAIRKKAAEQYLLQQLRNVTNDQLREQRAEYADVHERAAMAYGKKAAEQYLLQQLRNVTNDQREQRMEDTETLRHNSDDHNMQAERYFLQQLRNATKDYRREERAEYPENPSQNSNVNDHGVQSETWISRDAGENDDRRVGVEGPIISVEEKEAEEKFSQDVGDSDDRPTIIPFEANEIHGEPTIGSTDDERLKTQLSATLDEPSKEHFNEQGMSHQNDGQEQNLPQDSRNARNDFCEPIPQDDLMPLSPDGTYDNRAVQSWRMDSPYMGDVEYRPNSVEGGMKLPVVDLDDPQEFKTSSSYKGRKSDGMDEMTAPYGGKDSDDELGFGLVMPSGQKLPPGSAMRFKKSHKRKKRKRTSYRVRYDGPSTVFRLEDEHGLLPVPETDNRFDGGPSERGLFRPARRSSSVGSKLGSCEDETKPVGDAAPPHPHRRNSDSMSDEEDGNIGVHDEDELGGVEDGPDVHKVRPHVWITPIDGLEEKWLVKRVWYIEEADEDEHEHSVQNGQLMRTLKVLFGVPNASNTATTEGPSQSPGIITDTSGSNDVAIKSAEVPIESSDVCPISPSDVPINPSDVSTALWHIKRFIDEDGDLEETGSEYSLDEEELRIQIQFLSDDKDSVEDNSPSRRVREVHAIVRPDIWNCDDSEPKIPVRKWMIKEWNEQDRKNVENGQSNKGAENQSSVDMRGISPTPFSSPNTKVKLKIKKGWVVGDGEGEIPTPMEIGELQLVDEDEKEPSTDNQHDQEKSVETCEVPSTSKESEVGDRGENVATAEGSDEVHTKDKANNDTNADQLEGYAEPSDLSARLSPSPKTERDLKVKGERDVVVGEKELTTSNGSDQVHTIDDDNIKDAADADLHREEKSGKTSDMALVASFASPTRKRKSVKIKKEVELGGGENDRDDDCNLSPDSSVSVSPVSSDTSVSPVSSPTRKSTLARKLDSVRRDEAAEMVSKSTFKARNVEDVDENHHVNEKKPVEKKKQKQKQKQKHKQKEKQKRNLLKSNSERKLSRDKKKSGNSTSNSKSGKRKSRKSGRSKSLNYSSPNSQKHQAAIFDESLMPPFLHSGEESADATESCPKTRSGSLGSTKQSNTPDETIGAIASEIIKKRGQSSKANGSSATSSKSKSRRSRKNRGSPKAAEKEKKKVELSKPKPPEPKPPGRKPDRKPDPKPDPKPQVKLFWQV